jgi:electron transfer flavoprotein beta subunit
MKIVVTIKQVPDPDIPSGHFRVDESANRVIPPAGVQPVMNGYDANALEAALKLKEQHGGEVIALTLGPPEARDALKRAIAMGATSAVLVSDPAIPELDTLGTSRVLAAAIKNIGDYDLVLCGRQASDTDAGQVQFGLGEVLGLPTVSPVRGIEMENGAVKVQRIAEDGYQALRVPRPCLLAVSSEIGEPRYPPLKGIMAAGRAQIPTWGLSDLGLSVEDLAPRRELRKLFVEKRESQVEMIEADDPAEAGAALALKLREAKLI